MRVLLMEDDVQLGRAMQAGLAQQGHAVDWVRDGQSGRQVALEGHHDALLLDLGLPGEDGLVVLRRLRAAGFSVPVLIVTARDDIAQRVAGLDAGADDYILKPFDLGELGARLRAVQRRLVGRAHPLLQHGPLVLDPAARQVELNGHDVPVTSREFELLQHLLEHRGRVRSRGELEASLYGWNEDIGSNTVEVHVHNLRRKLGRDLIRTVHGLGYVIDLPPAGKP